MAGSVEGNRLQSEKVTYEQVTHGAEIKGGEGLHAGPSSLHLVAKDCCNHV
jgi:hypothetical protein